jgi:hypothetical protein
LADSWDPLNVSGRIASLQKAPYSVTRK